MLVRLLRILQGYLKIQITGYSPERFLNLCKHKKIHIWGLESHGNAYEMYMSISGFRKLRPITRKTQTKVRVIERYGIPFFLFKYRKRKLFFASIITAVILVYFLSFFIWNIELIGNQSITDDVIFDYLESKNIYHGMLKNKVNCEQIVKDMRKNFNEIVWVSVSMDGTELSIEVKENTDTFRVSEIEEEPSDIIAKKEGTIVNIITRHGIPNITVGDTVKAGDLLVCGTIDVLNDSGEITAKNYVDSDADIWAETVYHYKDTVNSSYKQKDYTEKNIPFFKITLFKYFFKIGYYKDSKLNTEEYTEENQLRLKENFYLPVWWGKQTVKEYKWKEMEYTEEEREAILTERFERFCRDLEAKNAIIIDKKLYITHNTMNSTAISEIKLQEPIGEERKIIDFSSEPMVEYNGL